MKLPHLSLSALLTTLFLGVVLAASAIVFFSQQQSLGGWRIMIVQSGSMEPNIKTGSIVFVKNQPEYSVDNVITFQDSGRLVTHRIIEKKVENWQSAYLTKGDANQSADVTPVRYNEIVGKVQFSVPLVGYFLSFLKTPFGVMLFVVIPGTILLYEHLRKIKHAWQSGTQVVTATVLAFSIFLPLQSTFAVYAATAQVTDLQFQTIRWQNPQAEVERVGDELFIHTEEIGGVDSIFFRVEYDHEFDDSPLHEVLEREVPKPLAVDTFDLPPLTIGTCSDGVCTPHEEVENMEIKILFKNGSEKVASQELFFDYE